MAPRAKAQVNKDDIVFFNEIDLKKDGSISSEYPCWFFDVHIEEMKESIASKKRQLKLGLVHPEMVGRVQAEVENQEKRMKEIENSKPKLSGAAQDFAYGEYKKLCDQLSDSMPTRREDRQGFVRPHEELQRLNTPYVSVDPKIAAACGIKGSKGKITGKQAARCVQIIGKALGENTNIERLRRDGGVESYKTMDGMTAKILERLAEGSKRAMDEGR